MDKRRTVLPKIGFLRLQRDYAGGKVGSLGVGRLALSREGCIRLNSGRLSGRCGWDRKGEQSPGLGSLFGLSIGLPMAAFVVLQS